MRAIYSLAWLFALPLAFVYLLWRSRRQPAYRRHWGERLGATPELPPGPVIWLHAVSVGETRAAAPLVAALRHAHPDHALLLTHATPTGREAGAELFGDSVHQAYLPYDVPVLVQRFLRRVRPRLGILMETEIWPNLFATCARQGIPLYLVNARLSEKSARGYGRLRRLIAPAVATLAGVAAQTRADADRLVELGARRVEISGNLKFDVTPPTATGEQAAELRRLFAGRFVLLAASTRDGEEAPILDACLRTGIPDALLVIVPRHPQRFDAVAALLTQRGIDFVRRSEAGTPAPHATVFLGDSMGEMAAYYAAADVAFIGGSLLPHGGQNLIEAAAAGCPFLVGPHTWNFQDAAEQAITEGAGRRIEDADALAREFRRLHLAAEERRAMAAAGRRFSERHRGATARVMAMLREALG